MIRRVPIFILCIIVLFTQGSFGEDRDAQASDLKGIPKSHKYFWAVLGGTAAGAGLGIIAPGGTKSAIKGALLGGSATSAFYLAKNPRAARESRAWAHLITNTALGTGIGWTACDCGGGAWAGGLIGGGATAVWQAFKSRKSRIASVGGTDAQSSTGYETTANSQVQDSHDGLSSNEKAEKDANRPERKKPPQEFP